MKVAILKYNAGNTQSVIYALKRIGIEPLLTNTPEEIRSADKVIFPGVGEASTTMEHLRETGLDKIIPTLKQPVIGICLGLQLMCRHSEENDTAGLGIFDVEVRKFQLEEGFKIPHMGWNTLQVTDNPLLKGLPSDPHAYFVHSYYAEISPFTIGESNYINRFSAALHRDNFYAVQFHPEKSAETGATILKNFIEL
ncbi:MAG: imidazole glycerol phosphate synthase subunit HisH [Cyclobacteriaceae bacterium]|nr:imidazole glycerol phosphate synthase subunit HisH [Cyclobacteriaceae bacterium]